MTDAIADELGRIAMSPNLAATLARAGEYARAQAHAQLTLEHLLLALAEDADAALVLTVSNIDVPRLVAEISEGLGRIEERVPPERATTASLAVAPDLRRILEAAAAAARQSRRRDINGAIVLAAIVGDGRSTAAHLLRAQGLTFEEAIRALQRAQAAAAPRQAPASAPAPAAPVPPPSHRAPASTDAILASARERVQTRAAPGLSEIRAYRPAAEPAPQAPAAETVPERQATPTPTAQEAAQSVTPSVRTPVAAPELPAAAPKAAPPQASQPPEPAPEVHAPPVARAPAPAPRPEDGVPRPTQPAPVPRQAEPAPSVGSPSARPAEAGETQPRGPEQPRPARPAQTAPRGPDPAWTPQRPQDLPLAPEAMTRAGPRVPPPGVHHGHPAPGTAPGPMGWRAGPAPDGAPPRQAGARVALREAPRLDPARDISAEDFARELRAPASAPAGGRRRHPGAKVAGQLVENIPRRMRLAIPVLVEARVGRAEVQALAAGLEGGGGAYRHEVVVTKAMSVRLRAPDGGFWVEMISPETQWIGGPLGSNEEFAGWRWNVTPRLRGRHRLQLLVSAHTIGADGLAAETALPDQLIEVKVRTNYGASAMRWSGWLTAAIVGGLLARFGEEFYAASAKMAARIMSGG